MQQLLKRSLILNALTDTIYSVGKDKVYPKYLIKSDLGNRVLSTGIKNDTAKLERFSARHGRVYTTFANEGALETKDNLIITMKSLDKEAKTSEIGTFFYNKMKDCVLDYQYDVEIDENDGFLRNGNLFMRIVIDSEIEIEKRISVILQNEG